ncbi:hypothetical protein F5Y19DRAFT_469903 [Xylariaceae sp. FL1651]|nr:hypothetical protein F5Y19DRAFT_469903 [Xylariaceae sp. FL1651]
MNQVQESERDIIRCGCSVIVIELTPLLAEAAAFEVFAAGEFLSNGDEVEPCDPKNVNQQNPSGNRSESSSSLPSVYRTADGIIRSILDSNASPADISPSGELYRAIERFHSHRRPSSGPQRDLVRNHLNRWATRASSQNAMSSDDNSDTQRALPRDSRPSNTLPLDNLPPSAPILPPLRSLSTRRPSAISNNLGASTRTRPSDRFSRGYHALTEPWAEANDDAFDLWDHWDYELPEGQEAQEDTRRFGTGPNSHSQSPLDDGQSHRSREDMSSQLRALLDFTNTTPRAIPELFTPLTPQQHEPPEDARRVKRRKLDSDRLSSNFRGFQYGKYGQVQPGQLTMELVSCDGGIYSDDTTKYAAENILKNDQSVYCTEGPRCNIVLRHQGATVFTLTELVIKAPRSNFTSPVQVGMVFVSMASDHLLNRTAQYQIQYSPSRSSSRRIERETQPLNPIVSIRHNEDGTTMTRAQVRARRLYNIGLDDEDNDLGVAQIPSEFNVSLPPFQVTAECSDDEADDLNARLDGRTPNRIISQPVESDSSDDAGPDDFSLSGTDYLQPRRRNRSSTALAQAAEAAQLATQEAVRAVGGELMTPRARFDIERPKSSYTIHFNPPVSGRFILLKMWNPHRNPHGNIDIQAIVAKGFAGPRFFPSVELR